MMWFGQEGNRLATETNLNIGKVLKCFDAMPILFHQRETAIQPTTVMLEAKDIDALKYIGGYILKKMLGKSGLAEEEQIFLHKCCKENPLSPLIDITNSFLNMLIYFEKEFRKNRSLQAIDMKQLTECMAAPAMDDYILKIIDREILPLDRVCVQKIGYLFYKIRGHRLANKTAEEKKCTSSRPLRRSLKK